jgi:hypothetical protein
VGTATAQLLGCPQAEVAKTNPNTKTMITFLNRIGHLPKLKKRVRVSCFVFEFQKKLVGSKYRRYFQIPPDLPLPKGGVIFSLSQKQAYTSVTNARL